MTNKHQGKITQNKKSRNLITGTTFSSSLSRWNKFSIITRANATLTICITNNLLEKGNDASKMKLLER
ncbi:hypothetical protein RJ60_14285 [Mesotoga sp. B105.6.4]|nr:hypothetical protein RJ60_14285 [Mesotoga sp. B105.6.4]